MVLNLIYICFHFYQIQQNRDYLSPVGETNGSSYEVLGQNSVQVYSTMQNSDLLGHGSNYETLGQETVQVYSTMQTRDLN